jgi:DNA primase
LQPPDRDWQLSKHFYVKKCQVYLWSKVNRPALDYLRGRGLQEGTIDQAQLGYDPGRQAIIIPWYIEGELWRLGTKSLLDASKAPFFAGFKQGLYNADHLTAERPALLLEGEFDALIVGQEAGDLVAPVATGGVTLGRQVRWVATLARLPHVFVAFDDDPPGERAAAGWLEARSHDARRCRPVGAKDPNDMLQAGMDLRQWLADLPVIR